MNKRKYRLFVICCLVLDLLVMLISGYRYLDRKIPDEIQISRGKKTEDVTEVLSTPFVTFEEAVTVSQDGGYILPCKLLGYIPFKEIKVTPATRCRQRYAIVPRSCLVITPPGFNQCIYRCKSKSSKLARCYR